jgi:putative transcriptional regulator
VLVASRDLRDPNFFESVVLLLEYNDHGAVGLIVNRPTDMPVSSVLKDVPAAKGREDLVYAGGPVAAGGLRALRRVRSGARSEPVFGDVYLVSTRDELQAAMASGVKQSEIRVYAGYAGWGPGQLERELLMGAWHIARADEAAVFTSKPETVWPRLIERTDLQLALRVAGEP